MRIINQPGDVVGSGPSFREDRCVIVGSGPSASGFIPPAGLTIIAVNGAIEWLPRAEYWFSLDDSPKNITCATQQRSGVTYYSAGWRCAIPGVKNLRRESWRGTEPEDKNSPEWWFWRWSCKPGLSTDRGAVNTGNSAYGALNLAYHLGFRDVALIGVDATDEERIEGGKPNNLAHLPLLFRSALAQVNVVSCGKLTGITQMPLSKWIHSTQRISK